MSIEEPPVGSNVVYFSEARTGEEVEYTVRSRDDGWTFVLRTDGSPGARYYLNAGRSRRAPPASG
jgi:hypothetical protein